MAHPVLLANGARIILALARLDERERHIVVGRYWRNETLDILAARLGVSRNRICQLEQRALRKLRTALTPLAEAA